MGSPTAKAKAGGGRTDVDVGTIHWDDVRKLMDLDVEYNRPDRQGAFGGWKYDPETKTQRWEASSEGMKAAEARMNRRLAGEGFEEYKAPESAGAIRDAILQSRMDRMGVSVPQAAAQPAPQPQPQPQPPMGQPQPPMARPPMPQPQPPQMRPPVPPPVDNRFQPYDPRQRRR